MRIFNPGNPISWAENMIIRAQDALANGVLGGNRSLAKAG